MRRVGICVLLVLLRASAAWAQDFGHKLNGTLGLHAGDAPQPGVAVGDMVVDYRADELRDRNGDRIPVSANLEALATMIGVSGTAKLGATLLSAAIAVPLARVTVDTDRPETSVDLFGLGDVYIQPVKLGWSWQRLELVTAYGFYVPTGEVEPGGRGGVGQGQWSHQFGLGGTGYFDQAQHVRLSLLATYTLNQRKQAIDVTRGDTVQLQGGAGVLLFGALEMGAAGYALWQVRDDRGADLPQVLRGARDRVFGLGPELDVFVPRIRAAFGLRYQHDFGVESRPDGEIFAFTATWLAWRPSAAPPQGP